MDKNTIIGMLLMVAVVFGFMYFQTPSEAEIERQKQQDSIANVQQHQSQAVAAQKDSLTATDIESIKQALAIVSAKGQTEINQEGVRLSMQENKPAGTVTVESKTVNIQALLDGTIGDARIHNLAVNALRQVVGNYMKNGSFASHLSGTQQVVKLQNQKLALEFNTKGGVIQRATLKDYTATVGTKNVELISPADNSYSFVLNGNTQRFDTRNYYFTPKQVNDSTLDMVLDLGAGAQWTLRYTLVPNTYMVRMQIVQRGMQSIIPTNINTIDFAWHQTMSRHEQGRVFEERNSGLYYKYAGSSDVEELSASGNDEKETTDKIKWFSMKNQFFSAVLIADNSSFEGAKLTSKSIENADPKAEKYLKDLNITSSMPYNSAQSNPASFYFYLGPNKYDILSDYDRFSPNEDLHLTKLIPLGWSWLRWINTLIVIPVFNWLGEYISNYGIIILILTILIKLVLSPLTFKSYNGQAKMRILQPDVQAINEKYPNPDDAIKRQQKTMELYSLAGASPLGGCLPMMLQMPFLIALFWFFPSCIELRGQSFLWAHDLSAPDVIYSWTTHIPLISDYFGNHISLWCLLMTVTNILYTYLTMQSQQSQNNQMPGMKWMMYLMPVMFLVFFNNYASGLSYYYFLSLLITIGQTYLSRYMITEEKVRATMAANAKKPRKKSGFMARLEEAQKMQQQALREREKQKSRRR